MIRHLLIATMVTTVYAIPVWLSSSLGFIVPDMILIPAAAYTYLRLVRQ